MKLPVLAASLALACTTTQAITVLPNGGLTDLGLFAAGTYQLSATGVVDLCGDGTFPMLPDGIPAAPITCGGYGAAFNPHGAYSADGWFGPAGPQAKLGALMGTFNAGAHLGVNPSASQYGDWFLIGTASTITLASARHIYAAVNDTYYPNDTGAFEVSVTPVPEAGVAWLTLAGLGVVVRQGRRGRVLSPGFRQG